MESHTDLLCPTGFAVSNVKVGIAERESLVRLEICEKMSHGFEKSNDFSVGGMFG